MASPVLSGIHHIKIPVTDLARSVRWYERVFGFAVTMEFPDADNVVRGVAGTVPGLGDTQPTLRVNPGAAHGCIGFDPVSFAVGGETDVRVWATHLDAVEVAHSPVIEASIGWLLVFDDPDGTARPRTASTTRTGPATGDRRQHHDRPARQPTGRLAPCRRARAAPGRLSESDCAASAEVYAEVAIASGHGRAVHARTRCVNRHLFLLPVANIPGRRPSL
jgi:catechol 2,3-dioxygenase-like lactoylglutathione lyase family enzyme